MKYERFLQSLRDDNLGQYLTSIDALSIEELKAPNVIPYANWFKGIGMNSLQIVSFVRPRYAKHLLKRKIKMDLMSACALADVEAIRSILSSSTDVLGTPIDGLYPIQFATRKPASLKALFDHGDNPNRVITKLAWFDWEETAVRKGCASYTLLHMVAVGRGSVDSAKVILDAGGDLYKSSSPFGELPIHLAAIYGKASLLKWFVEQGCNVDARTTARHKDAKIGKLFNESHFKPFESSYNKTALMLACGEGQTDAVKMLLELGADPSAMDTHNFTAFHYACGSFWEENVEIIRLLLDAGVTPTVSSYKDTSPKDLAVTKGYNEVVKLLARL